MNYIPAIKKSDYPAPARAVKLRPWARLNLVLSRRRQRRALRALDGRLLADIGRTPEEARAEAAKPFWR